jgi:hypothetical protein
MEAHGAPQRFIPHLKISNPANRSTGLMLLRGLLFIRADENIQHCCGGVYRAGLLGVRHHEKDKLG